MRGAGDVPLPAAARDAPAGPPPAPAAAPAAAPAYLKLNTATKSMCATETVGSGPWWRNGSGCWARMCKFKFFGRRPKPPGPADRDSLPVSLLGCRRVRGAGARRRARLVRLAAAAIPPVGSARRLCLSACVFMARTTSRDNKRAEIMNVYCLCSRFDPSRFRAAGAQAGRSTDIRLECFAVYTLRCNAV